MLIKASFDDGTVQDLRVAELMRKYDVETIFYWPVMPEAVNEAAGRISLTNKEMSEIAKDFEIGSHTITHPLLTRIPIEQARVEIEQSKTMLEEKFDQNIISFCYPRGYSNPAIQEAVVEAGYLNARSVLVGYVHQTENPFFEQTAVHVACNRKEYAGADWLEYALKLLDIAIKVPNSIYHFFGHSWECEQNNQWKKLEVLCQELSKVASNGK